MCDQIFVQSLAIIALIIWALSYHFKERRYILLIQLASFAFWIPHFMLLGAFTGAVLVSVSAIRLFVFSFKKKENWTSNLLVFWVFIIVLFISTILTFEAYYAIFALLGGIFATIASWQNKQKSIRILFIPSHIFWIIYDLFAGSYGGAISETILGISALISLFSKKKI